MFIIALGILGLLAMLLWNALIPDLFHGPMLNYWQAVGLVVLSRVLVGIRGPRRHWWKPWHWGKRHHWKDASNKWDWNCVPNCGPSSRDWREWATMSPEERRKAKEEWKKWGKEGWKHEFTMRFGEDKPKPGDPTASDSPGVS